MGRKTAAKKVLPLRRIAMGVYVGRNLRKVILQDIVPIGAVATFS